jgi:hypothetical protein
MAKDYTIEKIEKPEEVIKRTNGKIALNTIFMIAGFLVAGVGFGVATGIMNAVLGFGGVGITSASIKALKENLKVKSTAKEQMKGHTK